MTVLIKQLEWKEVIGEPDWFGAENGFGTSYEVRLTSRGVVRMRTINDYWRDFDGDLDAAKAYFQADFETRIRASLEDAEPVAFLVDLDGTGSLHPASKGDPRSFPVYASLNDAMYRAQCEAAGVPADASPREART